MSKLINLNPDSTEVVSEEIRAFELDRRCEKGTIGSKDIHLLAAEVDEFQLNMHRGVPAINKEKHTSFLMKIKTLSSHQEGLTKAAQNALRSLEKQITHLGFQIDYPIAEEIDDEALLPNFASNLRQVATQIKETGSTKLLSKELSPTQRKEILSFLEGKMDPESVAKAIEKYLKSLQAQAAKAESYYREGERDYTVSVLGTMLHRMGLDEAVS